MRGKRLTLSLPRRMITDVLRFGAKVPNTTVERTMDLGAVIAARARCPLRPPWAGIFAKAYATTAHEFPELRRAFVKWPWPHLYEYPTSIAGITVNRSYRGEPCVLLCLIKNPRARSIGNIARIVHDAVEAPLDDVKDFKRALAWARLPGIVRRPLFWLGYNSGYLRANCFGTFVVSAFSFLDADLVFVPSLTTTLLTFDVFQPDGRVSVRLMMDHRVFDGVTCANILARLESILRGSIREELELIAADAGPSRAT